MMKFLYIFLIRGIAELFIPGSGLLISVILWGVTAARIAEAAGPSDCWTGHPDEKELRKNEKLLTRIADKRKALAEQAVAKAEMMQLGLPGSKEEQKKDINLIMENYLDDFDSDSHLRKLSSWSRPTQLDDSNSSFWIMILEEIIKLN